MRRAHRAAGCAMGRRGWPWVLQSASTHASNAGMSEETERKGVVFVRLTQEAKREAESVAARAGVSLPELVRRLLWAEGVRREMGAGAGRKDLVGPVVLSRDAEGRLSCTVEGRGYVLVARRGRKV